MVLTPQAIRLARSQEYIGERIFIHAAKRKPTRDGLALPAGIDPLPEGHKRDAASDVIIPDSQVGIPLGKIVAVATLSEIAQLEETVSFACGV